ncbi:MAG: ATP-binding protein [Bacillota bacterium]
MKLLKIPVIGVREIKKKLKLTLKTKIIIYTTLIVSLLMTILGGFGILYIDNSIQNMLGKNVINIAKVVALNREIQVNMVKPRGNWIIQPLIEDIRRATNAECIQIFDMEEQPYARSVLDKRNRIFLYQDEKKAFLGKVMLKKIIDPKGNSIRALAPIFKDGKQVGVVVVSILYPQLTKFLTEFESGFYALVMGGFLLTILSATLLANNIKSRILGLEPEEIAKLLKERHIIIQTVKEGILAVDREYKITMINGEGKRIMGVGDEIIGKDIREIVNNSHMAEVMESGIPEVDSEHILDNNRAIVANTLPINVGGEIMGAVSSFRDLTDVKNLAEQLTGVRKYIDALRSQNHEFLNKMHTISGLLQLKCYDEAMKYIDDISDVHEEMLGFLTKNFKEPMVSGLLLAKYNRMQELKIKFSIDPSSRLGYTESWLDTNILVTIIGNLLENAMDAVSELEQSKRHISLTITDEEDGLEIIVTDTGIGIAEENLDKIFRFGFTTKLGENKGVGLALIKEIIDSLKGNIEIESQENEGTEVIVFIPK